MTPHVVVLFLRLVAVITCVILVLFSHVHPDKDVVCC